MSVTHQGLLDMHIIDELRNGSLKWAEPRTVQRLVVSPHIWNQLITTSAYPRHLRDDAIVDSPTAVRDRPLPPGTECRRKIDAAISVWNDETSKGCCSPYNCFRKYRRMLLFRYTCDIHSSFFSVRDSSLQSTVISV